jgi:hypothetical protein
MNNYILDTNICIYIINQSPQNVLKKFHELDYRQISISIITYGELFYGILKLLKIIAYQCSTQTACMSGNPKIVIANNITLIFVFIFSIKDRKMYWKNFMSWIIVK